MSVSYFQAQKKNVRVTLDLSVYSDFDARQINWAKLFELSLQLFFTAIRTTGLQHGAHGSSISMVKRMYAFLMAAA